MTAECIAPPPQADKLQTVEALMQSLVNLLDRAESEIEHDSNSAKLAIRRAVSILRIEIDRLRVPSTRNASTGELASWQISRVQAYVDSRLSERIHVGDLSRVVRRSTAHFCRAFKRTTGETPHSYIIGRRLRQAEILMLVSDAPMSEIAIRCGFSDQAHFCNRFRLATGQSPAAWRRAHRERAIEVGPSAPPDLAHAALSGPAGNRFEGCLQ